MSKEEGNESENKPDKASPNSAAETIHDDKDISSHLEESSILPHWLTKYLEFRFNLLDRTGKCNHSSTIYTMSTLYQSFK